eukprot:TRINITY_DN3559_c0_g1_i2.p1 TRINITY_DN3559_c0_g1~~TRINITY_DN3559_c0_g1_i2.p1  ORF type:complete len:405 (+),score=103.72 TRINITY_DN3559_c0_g1_i2:100-1314(+)
MMLGTLPILLVLLLQCTASVFIGNSTAAQHALSAAIELVTAHKDHMEATLPEDQLLLNALKNHGASTERQLQVLFRKCVTPGARIVIGVLGGSISGFTDVSYQWPLQTLLQKLCPEADVQLHSGARGGHGSLTVGMCMRCGLGRHVDLLILEFSLNDMIHYHRHNETGSPPFELAVRTALTSFQHAPAVVGLFFWGPFCTYDSAQAFHAAICAHYGVTGLSIRDVVWPYYQSARAPWAQRADVCYDVHHPTDATHRWVADLIGYYMSGLFLDWARKEGAGTASGRRMSSLLPPPALPLPLCAELAGLDLVRTRLKCRWAIEPNYGLDSQLVPYESEGWTVEALPPCVKVGAMNSTALLPVDTVQGVVMLSNCYRPPAFGLRYWETEPAFQVSSILEVCNVPSYT